MLDIVLGCFKQLCLKPKYKGEWRTSDQWAEVLLIEFKNTLTPILNGNKLEGKDLDKALRKDKVIKENLLNYAAGTNATGIICREYRPSVELNGVIKRV
jgi:hypothetical protein